MEKIFVRTNREILVYLLDHNASSISEIYKGIGITYCVISKAIKWLALKKLIRTRKVGRIKKIYLTDKGKKIAKVYIKLINLIKNEINSKM